MEYMGVVAFVFVLCLWDKVRRLEARPRGNHIRPRGPGPPAVAGSPPPGRMMGLGVF